VPGATLGDGVPHGGCTGAQPLAVPHILEQLSAAGLGWHIDTGIHCIRLILGGVFDRFPRLQIIVGHQFEALSWMAWRTDYSFQKGASGGLKRTIKEYLRENFYGGILAGDFANQESGAVDPAGVCPTTPIWAW